MNRMLHRKSIDDLLVNIADYVIDSEIKNQQAYDTAKLCLMDSLGCAILALQYPACTKLLGPIVPGATLPNGAMIPGTQHQLDPAHAAFNLGTMIRWLDYNDTWLAAEWGHPSDNFGSILSLADYLGRQNPENALTVQQVLTYAIKAYEIQGILALENSFNRQGLDHVILVRIATTAIATAMLGGNKEQIINAVSNAWIDGGALRTYRHAPNTGSRKSWAAGDACSRGIRLALMAMQGEMGYATALSADNWGFYDVLFNRKPFVISQDYNSYVMQNILFKVSYPAEFHAQTAVEAAMILHDLVKIRIHEIDHIHIETQEAAIRIIDKSGPLNNPADRDHCLQYMIAIPLIFGRLSADDYESTVANDPNIDLLRSKMHVRESKQFSFDYLNPEKRSIANSIQIFFSDGSESEKITIHYPIGHRNRREEATPLLNIKFSKNIATLFSTSKTEEIVNTFRQPEFMDMNVCDLMTTFRM